jgi:hypothetical protein
MDFGLSAMIVSYNSRCLELGAGVSTEGTSGVAPTSGMLRARDIRLKHAPARMLTSPLRHKLPKFSDSLHRAIRAGARAKLIKAAASSNCSHHQNYRFRDSLRIAEAQCTM